MFVVVRAHAFIYLFFSPCVSLSSTFTFHTPLCSPISTFPFDHRYKQVQAGTLSGLGNSTQTTMALSQDRALSKAQEDWAARLERNGGGPTKPRSPKFQSTSKRPPKDKVAPINGVPASYSPQQVLRVYLKR